MAVVEPDTAFWALVENQALQESLSGTLVEDWTRQSDEFHREMNHLRFGLKPSAVYFNPTEQCNFNCSYCYIPEDIRRNGETMTIEQLRQGLERLHSYFQQTLPEEVKPQLIFHGSEPMLAREAVFTGIQEFQDRFQFGVQTNATLLDDEAISFLTKHGVGIGISLDAPSANLADQTRKNWSGHGSFDSAVHVMEQLGSYPAFNVITTVTSLNLGALCEMVDFCHSYGVGILMLNPVRTTQKGGQELKPENEDLALAFCKALDRTYHLYEQTGRRIVIANFANILASILGPTSRRLMCDISPCGGGRCFFAVSAHGDVFPCSEFLGFPEYNGGNLFEQDLEHILASAPFKAVTGRKVENIIPCTSCAIRHFCGAPCPAEVKAITGELNAPSPYCEFYEEQVRYAFRVIAEEHAEAYLWESWQEETEEVFRWVG